MLLCVWRVCGWEVSVIMCVEIVWVGSSVIMCVESVRVLRVCRCTCAVITCSYSVEGESFSGPSP